MRSYRAKWWWKQRGRSLGKSLLRFRWGRKVVCWWGWHMAPGRYTAYWRNECEKLRAQQIRDQLKIRDLVRENEGLKRGFRRVQMR